ARREDGDHDAEPLRRRDHRPPVRHSRPDRRQRRAAAQPVQDPGGGSPVRDRRVPDHAEIADRRRRLVHDGIRPLRHRAAERAEDARKPVPSRGRRLSEDAAHLAGRASGWHFWIDRGGTFTDVVARDPAGRIASMKLLSEDPARYEDAAVEAVRRFLAGQPDGERHVAAVRMGTTVATNALLERRGEPTALVVTAGLRDVLRIGTQQRPDIFALDIRLPEMLYTHVVEANERMSAAGEVV